MTNFQAGTNEGRRKEQKRAPTFIGDKDHWILLN